MSLMASGNGDGESNNQINQPYLRVGEAKHFGT